ncbi:TonB-dependent receptor [Saccharicrinis aurantiacus]|uniref:TonB-dependent receptor n=1 Tax=Saccharicrinis aurantiacus TaxID=1849719 RepID=UPI0024916355|nr:carboxypeptidase-like regulatory domain-containing protein [Saccharicrinis aurantiacus]
MKTTIIIIYLFSFYFVISSQTKVIGTVVDKKGKPLTGVNIYFKDTYDGSASDLEGNFHIETNSENTIIIARFLGYTKFEQEIEPDKISKLLIVLKENINSIDAVTITAGNFAAGDESKASVLKPLDIYTTAGAVGNAIGALTTLPGTQPANDDGRLLVRGGEAYETRTVIDGLLAGSPYFTKVPDVPTRGRFSPSLFSGTMFNTGGYSAEYGQALSSILSLKSNDLATKDMLSLSLMSIGGGAEYTNAWDNNSLSIILNYINMAPYYGLIDTKQDWEKPVESGNSALVYRHKTKNNGILKAYLSSDASKLKYNSYSGVDDIWYTTQVKNLNHYGNITYKQAIGEKTCIKTGISATSDNPDIIYDTQYIKTHDVNIETRLTLVHDLSQSVNLRYGVSHTYTNYKQSYQANINAPTFLPKYTDHLSAAFIESEIKFNKNIALRTGLRYEYASVLNKSNFAPRIAMAFNTGDKSQVSVSYGHFYQNPEDDVLKFAKQLNYENAHHYILGYQKGSVKSRLFRLESYYKQYNNLVSYRGEDYYLGTNYNNSGYGHAHGIDLFWRDTKTVKQLDYWISYSFINSERQYKSFKTAVQPDFISNHVLSIVGKYYIPAINCQFGATYWLASDRNWYEYTKQNYTTHKGASTNELNLNISYLTHLFNYSTIIHFEVSNILGANSNFGYRRGPINDSDNNPVYIPITNDIKQFAFLGIFITLQ